MGYKVGSNFFSSFLPLIKEASTFVLSHKKKTKTRIVLFKSPPRRSDSVANQRDEPVDHASYSNPEAGVSISAR